MLGASYEAIAASAPDKMPDLTFALGLSWVRLWPLSQLNGGTEYPVCLTLGDSDGS